jgi:hypothetical protein
MERVPRVLRARPPPPQGADRNADAAAVQPARGVAAARGGADGQVRLAPGGQQGAAQHRAGEPAPLTARCPRLHCTATHATRRLPARVPLRRRMGRRHRTSRAASACTAACGPRARRTTPASRAWTWRARAVWRCTTARARASSTGAGGARWAPGARRYVLSSHRHRHRVVPLISLCSFNRVFDPASRQPEVYEELNGLVRSVMDGAQGRSEARGTGLLEGAQHPCGRTPLHERVSAHPPPGYNVCIFAYGQTGSGKTFTVRHPSRPPRAHHPTPRDMTERGHVPRPAP